MLLMIFIFFVKIDLSSCLFENKNEQDLFEEINHERKNHAKGKLEIHLTLQLAAEKRCANQEQLIESYQRIISNTYRNDDWPKEEQLNRIFPYVGETIYLTGSNIQNNIFSHSLHNSNVYQTNFVYMGIALHQFQNFSARCILYGSSRNSLSNHRRLLRLLYILISCGILLLSLIICSIINDRRRAKLKQQLEQEMNVTMAPKKSIAMIIDKDRKSSTRRGDLNRMTLAPLKATMNERTSAVHSFTQSPN